MKTVTALLLLLICLVFPSHAFAIAKFDTTYQISYQIEPSGNTHVNFLISQKNNLSVVYATDYGLSISETNVSNIKVNDEGNSIKPDVIKSLNQTSISFPFQKKVVGKDQVHTFSVEYDTTDITTKFGNTWQINIPRLETGEDIINQTIILTVPETFTAPAYIDPKPDVVNKNIYYFSGKQTANKPISAIFGKTQYYQGQITYHLENTDPGKIRTEIALPPDTSYQSVYYQNLDPKPESVTQDGDGNVLAHYLLNPQQKIDINLSFYTKIGFTPHPADPFPPEKYLAENDVWNYSNGIFNSPELRNLNTPKSIYDFVVDKLKYDYGKINRPSQKNTSASESLINNQNAICVDFTNIFVALSRKAGIPSRELEGFALSENPNLKPTSLAQDVLHAWPEYFDKSNNTWIQVDPTWANTTRGIDYFNKLDFNHIVFVIHGEKPNYPIPGGGYKNRNNQTKDIFIKPIEEYPFPQPTADLQFLEEKDSNIFFKVSNPSGVSLSANVIINENNYFQSSEKNLTVVPFSSAIFSVPLKKHPLVNESSPKAIIYINGQRFDTNITLGPTTNQIYILAGIGGFLAVSAILAGGLYLRRRRQKTSLYR